MSKNSLILVDEPLASLDPGLQIELLESMKQYADARNHAIVAILHDINQAMHHFDRLILVKEGQPGWRSRLGSGCSFRFGCSVPDSDGCN
jgi:ABC-type cobalamin/Fe3+-siderophores transport system ATPase subunit